MPNEPIRSWLPGHWITAVVLIIFSTVLPAQERVTPRAVETEPLLTAVLIARLNHGVFADSGSGTEESLKKALPSVPFRLLSAAEAQVEWTGDKSFLDMSKGLSGEHFVIALKDSRGKKVYQAVSPATVGESTRKGVQEAITRQAEVEILLKAAGGRTGEERVIQLGKIVSVMGTEAFIATYPALAAEITRSDVASVKAVRDQLSKAMSSQERTERVNRLHFDLSMVLRSLPQGADIQLRIAAIDKFIVDRSLNPEMKQIMVMRKYLLWSGAGRYQEALNALNEALAVSPDSELAARIPAFQTAIQGRLAATAEAQKKPLSQEAPPGDPAKPSLPQPNDGTVPK